MVTHFHFTLSLLSLVVISFVPNVFCLEFCGPALLFSSGTNACPSPSRGLRTIEGREVCCGYASPIDGYTPEGKPLKRKRRNDKYCGPYLVVDNIPRCPETHPYDATKRGKDRCCGEEPITQKQKDESERRSAANGTWTTDCVDLAAPGRTTDCPANGHRCEDPLWRDLMTEQCPKTCGRCDEWARTFGQQRGNAATAAVCRDGVGPNGQSECPANKKRCTDPIWRAFMERECPKTCGVCWEAGELWRTTKQRRTTTRTTTRTAISRTTEMPMS